MMFFFKKKEKGKNFLNIKSYKTIVNRYPLLTYIEEKKLAKEVYKKRDLTCEKLLVLCNLRFVIYIANQYIGYGLNQSDLIQEGNIGLIKAIRRFNPNLGVKLISFAVYWIKSEIHEYILRNWRIVKIATTKIQRKLFFNIRKNNNSFKDKDLFNLSKKLGIELKHIKNMAIRMANKDISLENNHLTKSKDFSIKHNLIKKNFFFSEDKNSFFAKNIEMDNIKNYNKKSLHLALNSLDIRARQIIQYRWLNKKKITLQQLSKIFGVSSERIRQIEKISLKKLKTIITNR